MENDSTKLLIALEDFISNHPTSTTIDIQNFIIGWNKAVEILSLSDDNINLINGKLTLLKENEKIFLDLLSNLFKNQNVWYDFNFRWSIIYHLKNKQIFIRYIGFIDKFKGFKNIKETLEFLTSMLEKHCNINIKDVKVKCY